MAEEEFKPVVQSGKAPTLPLGRVQPSLPILPKRDNTKRAVQAAEAHAHHEDNVRRARQHLEKDVVPTPVTPFPAVGQYLFHFDDPNAGSLVIDREHLASTVDNPRLKGDVPRKDISSQTYKEYSPARSGFSSDPLANEKIWDRHATPQQLPAGTVFDTIQTPDHPDSTRYKVEDSPLANVTEEDFKNGTVVPPSVLQKGNKQILVDGHHRMYRQRQLGMDPFVRTLRPEQFNEALKNKDY